MTRRKLLTLAAIATTALLPGTPVIARPDAPARPDIVVIVLDDAGFSDLGAYGSEIRTPNIDALAAGGLRYNRFDTRAVCSATRASLLTGRNSQTVRMTDLPSRLRAPDDSDMSKTKGEMPLNVQTVAQALAGAGYQTTAIGKWHLSPAYEGGPGGPADPGGAKKSWPLQRGFDHFYGFLGGWTDQYKPELIAGNTPVPAPAKSDYHVSADLVDHALTELDTARAAGKPVFLYLALGAPHSPIQVPARYADHYRGVYEAGWDSIRATRFARMKRLGIIPANTLLPARSPQDVSWDSLDPQRKRVFARFMATYAGFVEHTDEQIGRVVAHLKQTGRFDNTLIVLMSDNGGAGEGGPEGGFRKPYGDRTSVAEMDAHLDELGGPSTQALYQRPWANVSSAPFRKYKLWPYAGGTRDPFIVSWPRGLRGAKGAIRPQAIDVIDVAPTLLDVAGAQFAEQIEGVTQIPVAGRSFRATFGSAAVAGPRDVQFFELRGNRAIRWGKWKAVAIHQAGMPFESDRWELFDTSADYSESRDVAAANPQVVRQIDDLWWREARRYSTPALVEMPTALRIMEAFER